MNILYWHGYLLEGSGSNVYALNVAKEFAKENNVFLFSQERKELEGFDEHWVYEEDGSLNRKVLEKTKRQLVNVNPYIGKLLPVFVKDNYEYFDVKTFVELSDDELTDYIEKNVSVLKRFVIENNIDLIYCNHLAVSPYIMKKVAEDTGVPYVVVGHGSSLNYTMAVDGRYKKLSIEGMEKSRGVVFQSEYFVNRTLEVYEGDDRARRIIKEKTAMIPCGINKEKFGTILGEKDLFSLMKKDGAGGFSIEDSTSFRNLGMEKKSLEDIKIEVEDIASKVGSYSSTDKDLNLKLRFENGSPVISFVGRLIYSKGPHLFMMTLPYIFKKYPKAKVMFIGAGKLRGTLEVILGALKSKNLSFLLNFAQGGSIMEEGTPFEDLSYFRGFIEELVKKEKMEEYLEMGSSIDLDRVVFTGNLSHEILPTVMSTSDMLVVPSIFPESFGMIALEGMFLGNTPIAFDHSGLSEAVPKKENKVKFDERLVFNLRDTLLKNCQENISKESKTYFKEYAENFSYEKICKRLIKV